MAHVQSASLDWALSHAVRFHETERLPLPFEYLAIQEDWPSVRGYLASVDILSWETRPSRVLLSPKSTYAFRVLTQLDPFDLLLFSAIVYELGAEIEARRVPIPRNVVYSYRYGPDATGALFRRDVGWTQFQKAADDASSDSLVTHVVVADIADFYQRIYHHRLENALEAATRQTLHAKALMRLLSGWTERQSYGIPIGNAPARLLAELAISDVDEALLAQGIRFIRFNDDYRLFAQSHSEGYKILAILADTLYENHGLTLATWKTHVPSKEEFRRFYVGSLADVERTAAQQNFDLLVGELGLSSPYEAIEYDDLTDEQKARIDRLNLAQMFRDARQSTPIDLSLIRFVLRRLGQLGDEVLADELLDDLDVLYPIFPDIIRYLKGLRNLDAAHKTRLGAHVLELLAGSIVSELEYHRLWALDLFADSTDWNNADQFVKLLQVSPDLSSRRKLILALGRAGQTFWFQNRRRHVFDEPPWPRRALIAAASCLPPDARQHWYRAIEGRLDVLETAVARWAKAHPFA